MGPSCKGGMLKDSNSRVILIVLGPPPCTWYCSWSYPRKWQTYDRTSSCHQINQVCWLFIFFHLHQWTQICMKELQISLKCNNAKCSWRNLCIRHHLKRKEVKGWCMERYKRAIYRQLLEIWFWQVCLHTATGIHMPLASLPLGNRFLQGLAALCAGQHTVAWEYYGEGATHNTALVFGVSSVR